MAYATPEAIFASSEDGKPESCPLYSSLLFYLAPPANPTQIPNLPPHRANRAQLMERIVNAPTIVNVPPACLDPNQQGGSHPTPASREGLARIDFFVGFL